jgi:hypothetical protein
MRFDVARETLAVALLLVLFAWGRSCDPGRGSGLPNVEEASR